MKTPEEEFEEWIEENDDPDAPYVSKWVAQKSAFLVALEIGRKQGIEEAAEVVLSHLINLPCSCDHCKGRAFQAGVDRDAILKLKEKPCDLKLSLT